MPSTMMISEPQHQMRTFKIFQQHIALHTSASVGIPRENSTLFTRLLLLPVKIVAVYSSLLTGEMLMECEGKRKTDAEGRRSKRRDLKAASIMNEIS